MALNIENISLPAELHSEVPEDHFSQVIERLKAQKALPRDSFPKEMPFFTFNSISKEAQVKELFQDVNDPSIYKNLIKNIITLPEEKSPELMTQRLSAMQVMGFAQIILYKVLPCGEVSCTNAPREVATHNQYKDYEYECPFYHHEKDHRRIVLPAEIDGEFTYKANYFEDGKHNPEDKDKHSQNYFESMFHPLYYKMFRCKREYCNFSQSCPFYHSEDEKKTWDKVFANFIRKDRISYVKDKQKYFEQNNGQGKSNRNNNGEQVSSRFSSFCSTPTTPQPNNFRRPAGKLTCIKHLQPVSPGPQKFNDWVPRSAQKWDNKRISTGLRKESGDLANGNSSAVTFGRKNDNLFNRAC